MMNHVIRLLFLAVLMLVQGAVRAVDRQQRMDSLLLVLSAQRPDTNKVLTLLALADLPVTNTRATPIGNRTVHVEYAGQALQLARRLDWERGKALAWVAVSIGQEQDGRKDLAAVSLDSALSHAARLPMAVRGSILLRSALFFAVNEIDLDKADSLAMLAATCFEDCARPADVAASMEIHARVGIFRQHWVEAILAYYEAIDYAERHGAVATLAVAYEKTALILGDLGDVERSEHYYRRSIQVSDSIGDHFRSFMAQSNWANQLQQRRRPEQALALYRSASDLATRKGLSREEINRVDVGQARCLIALGRLDEARALLDQVRIDPGIPDLRSEQAFQVTSGHLELASGNYRAAVSDCYNAYDAPERYGSTSLRKEACECMVKAYRALGDLQAAMDWNDRLDQWSDSIRYREQANTVVRMELDREYGRLMQADSLRFVEASHRREMESQQQLARAEGRRNLFLFLGIGILLIAGGLLSRLRYISRTKRTIERQKEISDSLLLNILPEQVASELKTNGRAEARSFDNVTVLLSDFKGFTSIAEQLSPTELVQELSICFEAFDGIVARHGVEKIKTIGDAYMAAGGLPVPTPDSVLNTVLAALEMQAFMRAHAAQRAAHGKMAFEMRIGIHTGPVVAGIVGVKKFQYDLWGDTVNIASRMESCSEVGRVNISESTYELIKGAPELAFAPRGMIEAKGKGELWMYFVQRADIEEPVAVH